jgi:hypothetical protein
MSKLTRTLLEADQSCAVCATASVHCVPLQRNVRCLPATSNFTTERSLLADVFAYISVVYSRSRNTQHFGDGRSRKSPLVHPWDIELSLRTVSTRHAHRTYRTLQKEVRKGQGGYSPAPGRGQNSSTATRVRFPRVYYFRRTPLMYLIVGFKAVIRQLRARPPRTWRSIKELFTTQATPPGMAVGQSADVLTWRTSE